MALRFQKEIWERLTRRLFSRPGRFPRAGGLSACAGSAGAGAQAVNVDGAAALEETQGDYAVIHGRKFQPLPLRCQDFTLLWRDLELACRADGSTVLLRMRDKDAVIVQM